jgi:HAD superfamily hydrolase (TIGR01549 family)
MNPPSLVIFDLDGTVADTLDATYRCFAEAVAPVLGRTPGDDEILARMGPADQRIIADWAGPEEAERAVARLYACYQREITRSGVFAGIPGLLKNLQRAGRRCALFTGRGRPSTGVVLGAVGLSEAFAVTVTGDEIPCSKPAPDGLLRVLDLLREPPETAVYVGDSLMDLHCAAAAGVRGIGALWGSREREALLASSFPTAETVAALARLLGLRPES